MPTPATTTLGAIRTLVRERADMVGSTYCTDAELNSYISLSNYELYDLLIQKFGDNYAVSSDEQSTDGTNQLPLPDDFYKLLGVDVSTGGDQWVTLRQFNFVDRNRYSSQSAVTPYAFTNIRYRLLGNYLLFSPTPQSGQTVRIWYVPRLTALTQDSDVVDGVSGWEEYIVIDVAIKAKDKEESDTGVLLAQKQAIIQRIEAAAENRDAGMPMTVSDVRCDGWPFDREPW